MAQQDPPDIEAATASTTAGEDDNPETALPQDNKEETHPWWKRTFFRVLLALAGIVLVVIVILIPTVFLKKEEYKGPYYRDTNFDGLAGYSASCEDCSGIHYGSHVKLSADGNRMVFTSLRNEGTVEVWDYKDTSNEWVQHSLLFPHDVNNVGGHHRNLHENGTNIVDLDISEDGSRLLISQRTHYQASYKAEVVVGVYEDLNDEGWTQVGQVLEIFAVNLTRVNETEPIEVQGWGDAVKMSSDGNIIVVSAPKVDYYSPLYTSVWNQNIGMVQAFQLVKEESNEETWKPFGQPLFGRFEFDELGEKMALSGDGDRLALTSRVDGDSFTYVYIYEMVDGAWENDIYGDDDKVHASHTSRASDVIAISRDGKVLAVAESDFSPSAYHDKPYQGAVEIFMWDNFEEEFISVDMLLGDEAFQHFGTSIDIADDYTLVVGSSNSYSSRFPDGDRIDIFRMNNVTSEWDRVGPSFGWHVNDGWNAVVISADGTRVVAGAKGSNSEEHRNFGGVFVYDFTEA